MRSKLKLVYVKSKNRFKKLSKNKQRITMAVTTLVFVVAGQIIISSFAATTTYSTIPAVAEMQKLTEEVVTLTDDYAATPTTIATKKGAKQANPAKATKKTALIAKVKTRKEAYKKSIQYDPQTTANYFLPFATRDKLPSETIMDLEQVKVTKGKWITLLTTLNEGADTSKDNHTDRFLTYVTTESDQDIYIYGNSLPSISSGQSANLLGIVVDDTMAATLPATQSSVVTGSQKTSFIPGFLKLQQAQAQTITVDPNPAERLCAIPEVLDFVTGWIRDGGDGLYDSLANECYAKLSSSSGGRVFCDDDRVCQGLADESITLTGDSGKRKALIVPIQFENDENVPFSRDDLANTYQKVSNAYDRMSYGKFKPQFDVWQRWEETTEDNTFDSCTEDNLAARQAAFKRVARSVVSKNEELENKILNDGYTDVMYAYSSMRCAAGDSELWGWADLGHSRGANYIAESTMVLSSNTEDLYARLAGVMTHELGHSYGLGHAGGACNEFETSDQTKFCSDSLFAEYANTYDPMGNISDPDKADFSFANKMRLGWVSKDDAVSASGEGGSYTIETLNKTSGKRSIKVRHKDRDLYIDYRYGIGLLNYFSNEDKTTSLIGSRNSGELLDENGNGTGNYLHTYDYAGKLKPYRIGQGEDSICVIPNKISQDSIDVSIFAGGSCPMDDIANYVYEKTINHAIVETSANDLEIDKGGNIYMVDSLQKKVTKLDKDGKLLNTFTIPFDGVNPMIAINSKNEIYVTVSQILGRHESKELVIKYNQEGNELARWDPGALRHVSNTISGDRIADIVVDSKDDVYFIYQRRINAAWSGNTQSIVLKLNSALTEEVKRWYLTEQHLGTSLAVDKGDNIYAFEYGWYTGSFSINNYLPDNCVHRFRSSGEELSRWCKPNPGATNTAMQYYNTANDVFVPFEGMELDSSGNYLMLPVGYGNNIAMYGAYEQYFGRIGSSFGGFRSIEIAPDGKLYGSTGNRVTHVFRPDGDPIQYEELSY